MRRNGLNTRLALLAVVVLVPVVLAFWLQTGAGRDLRGATGNLREAQSRLLVSAEIGRRVVDIETALRGFALTHDSRFVTPRDDAVVMIPRLERRLRLLMDHDERGRLPLLAALTGPVDAYVREFADPLLAQLRSRNPGARSLEKTLEGKRRVDLIRARLAAFTRAEQQRVRATADQANDSERLSTLIGTIALISVPLLTILVALLVSRQVTRPLRRLEHAADRLRAGELDVRVPEGGTGEVARLARSFNAMAASLQESRTSLERSVRRAQDAAGLNQAMLDASNDGYVAVDEDGVVIGYTERAAQVFGHPVEDALGRLLADLVLPPEQHEAHHERRRLLLERGTRMDPYRVAVTRKDGRVVLVEITGSVANLSGSGHVAVYFVRDVTALARREEERDAEEAVSRALVRAGSGEDLVLPIIGALGGALHCLRGTFWELDEQEGAIRCTEIWSAPGFDAPEVDRLTRETRFVPGGPADTFAPVLHAWETGQVQWETFEHLPTEHSREAFGAASLRSTTLLPVSFGGAVLGVLALGTTETEEPDETRWLALRSIADLVGQILGRRRAEQEADRQKNEFFALVSHELRTPLTSVIGYLDLTRDEEAGPLNDEQKQYLDVVDRNAHRLMRLVGDLLFVAQIESGKLALDLVPTDVAQVVGDGVEAARPRAAEAGIALSAEIEPVTVTAGDGDRLGQLVDNLLSNAIKFTPAGGSVTVRLRRAGADAVLEVSDTGRGIAEADRERVFDRFYRAADARESVIPGLGLGLSICRAIVAGHGGTLEVDSEPGRGTTFRAVLPVGEA